ncbi:MAG: phenylacetate--CoA ligase, partial [Candidatus Delongbacteria bacterium]|nr:phenylacetate--CoA ligase [Candidatus Delongbacteria bacterium]
MKKSDVDQSVKYWQKEEETLDQSKRREIQLQRLKNLVAYVDRQVPFYHRKFVEAGITPEKIQSIEDIAQLPFTYKNDLRDNYPFGLFAAPSREIVRFHASSGTTGKSIVVGYTQQDIALWADVMGRTFYGGGVDDSDIVQVAYGYGLFTGGLGAHYGAERIGAAVIPIS